MKLSELTTCIICDGKIAPLFYKVRVSMGMIDASAANQVVGMTQVLGGAGALAELFVPNPHVAVIAGEKDESLWTEFLICQDCYMREKISLAELSEKVASRNESESED